MQPLGEYKGQIYILIRARYHVLFLPFPRLIGERARAMGNEHGKAGNAMTPAGIQSMDENLQRKFSKGIQFNSKYIS